jgi:hypothetical protein
MIQASPFRPEPASPAPTHGGRLPQRLGHASTDGSGAAPREKYNPKSDAPFRSVARLFIGFIHAGVLCGIVALLISYFMSVAVTTDDKAFARIFGVNMVEIPAPLNGRFSAARHFPEGEQVEPGELLGEISAPELEEELELATQSLHKLQEEDLRRITRSGSLADQHTDDAGPRNVRFMRIELENKIKQLRRIQSQLRVMSPVRGRIHMGLSGSKVIKANETLAYVWPEGGELRIQVEAPLTTMHKLLRKGAVKCRFSTARGEVCVTATPIPQSLRLKMNELSEDRLRGELFGFVECVPQSIPAEIRSPGLIGRL